jgi:hypothetical protein
VSCWLDKAKSIRRKLDDSAVYVNIIETHLLAYFRNNFQRDERIKVRSRQVNFIAFFVRMNFKTFSVFIVLEFIQPFTDEHGLN